MSRYDGLIIPRSYSEYINKTDAATLQQALQLSGVMDNVPTTGSNNPVKSGGVKTELEKYINKTDAATLSQALQLNGVLAQEVAAGNMSAVTSNAVYEALAEYKYYSVRADVAQDLTALNWNSYYAQLPIPDDVNEILMCSMYGFVSTDNGLRYQLAIGQDKKSLYVAKVNKNDTIIDEEKIGYMILYR